MQIYISNEKNTSLYLIDDEEKMHKYDDSEKLYYNALQKINKDISPLISNIKLTKKKSDASVIIYIPTLYFYQIFSHIVTI